MPEFLLLRLHLPPPPLPEHPGLLSLLRWEPFLKEGWEPFSKRYHLLPFPDSISCFSWPVYLSPFMNATAFLLKNGSPLFLPWEVQLPWRLEFKVVNLVGLNPIRSCHRPSTKDRHPSATAAECCVAEDIPHLLSRSYEFSLK